MDKPELDPVVDDPIAAAVTAATSLGKKMDALGVKVDAQAATLRHSRRISAVLAVGFTLDILLSIGGGLLFWQSHDASAKAIVSAKGNAASLEATCLASNETRAVLNKFFTTLLTLPASPPPTQAQVLESQKDLALVKANFNQHPCVLGQSGV